MTRKAVAAEQTSLREAALVALERSVAEGYSDPFRINAEQDLDPLHDSERFQDLIKKLESKRAGD